ncbi:unnamed protein product [Sphagnum tenellum]
MSSSSDDDFDAARRAAPGQDPPHHPNHEEEEEEISRESVTPSVDEGDTSQMTNTDSALETTDAEEVCSTDTVIQGNRASASPRRTNNISHVESNAARFNNTSAPGSPIRKDRNISKRRMKESPQYTPNRYTTHDADMTDEQRAFVNPTPKWTNACNKYEISQ